MRNFKVVLIWTLGSVIVFVLIMLLYGGGSYSMKRNELRSEYATIYNAQMMNFNYKGYYFGTVKELQSAAKIKESYYSFLVTPDEYILNDETTIEMIPEKYRNMATVGNIDFKLVAIGNLDGDDFFDVWYLDEDNNMVHIFDDDSNTEVKQSL